jgi:hypothetical protein
MTEVANPYKAAVGGALGRVKGYSSTAAAALDAAKTAWSAKAWTGGTSADFEAGLTAQATAAKNGGDACVGELQGMYDRQPDKVESTAWQVHWRNLR